MPDATIQTDWAGQFSRGLWRYIRPRFTSAGQDSFTDPPSQNEDMFEFLLNVMPPVRGDFDRRWGYRAWNTEIPQGPPNPTAPYPITLWGDLVEATRGVVVNTATGQTIFGETGQQLYNLTYAGAPNTRNMTSRGTLYTADGVLPQKWLAALGTTTQQWGIDVQNISGLGVFGPLGGGAAANSGTSGTTASQGPSPAITGSDLGFGGSVAWTNPGNIVVAASSATVSFTSTAAQSTLLLASNFGFTVPATATIIGVIANITASATGSAVIEDATVTLTRAGNPAGANHATNTRLTSSQQTLQYGSSNDLWGTVWSASDINNAGFGVAISLASSGGSAGTASVFASPSITVYYLLGTASSWTNPSNVLAHDAVPATATATTTGTNFLTVSNFLFGVPSLDEITGIGVTVYAKSSVPQQQQGQIIFEHGPLVGGGGPASKIQLNLQLLDGTGTPIGLLKTVEVATNFYNSWVFGGIKDLWGTALQVSDVNSLGFGVQLDAKLAVGSATISVDYLTITLYTLQGEMQLNPPLTGGVTLVSGRIYTYSFYNSTDQHYSDIGPFTNSTGPVTLGKIPLSAIPVSLDPQVDRKKILATGDGGDETTLYEVGDIPNASVAFTDNVDEETLLLNNQWQALLADGSSVGLVDNGPPPPKGKFPIMHRGRAYMISGVNLYYSKALSELLTPTNAIAGQYEEAWPPLNFFPSTSIAEDGRGLLSDGTVLYIGTDRRITRLFGDGPNTFLAPQVLFDNVGIINQDVWKLILIQGNPVGAMWLTPDLRVIGSDFNTYQDVGTPIQDVLNSINSSAALSTAWASYVGISTFNLFVLAVPTGNNVQPDTLLVFDIRGRMWYTWQLTDPVVGGFWWVALGGIPQFLIQAASGKLYVFDPTLYQDRVGDTPVSFECQMRTSWLALGDGTARKYLNEIEVTTGDPAMTVTVEGANTLGEFENPVTVVENAPLVVKPRGELAVFLAGGSTRGKYYRLTFTASDTATDLVRAFSIQGKILNRI